MSTVNVILRLWILIVAMQPSLIALPGISVDGPPPPANKPGFQLFADPLIPIRPEPSALENQDLTASINAFHESKGRDLTILLRFTAEHPDSPWKAGILLGVGQTYKQRGYYSRALDAFEQAWISSRSPIGRSAELMADLCAGEYLELLSRLGRAERLTEVLAVIGKPSLFGRASEKFAGAQEGLYMMRNHPQVSFLCGPMALARVHAALGRRDCTSEIKAFYSSTNGTSLAEVKQWADHLGTGLQIAKRAAGARVIVPAVVHWKAGHFAAIVKEGSGAFRVEDPTFKNDVWIETDAFDDEGSGYYLVPEGDLPEGWTKVEPEVAATIWGKGICQSVDESATRARDRKFGGCDTSAGMPSYGFHALTVSLNITDTPLFFDTPYGPDLAFTLTYNQREASQPLPGGFSNLGPKWNFNWIAYIEEPNPASLNADVILHTAYGGTEKFRLSNGSTVVNATYDREFESRLLLTRETIAPSADPLTPMVPVPGGYAQYRYVLTYPDGSKEYFQPSDVLGGIPPATGGRRVFRSRVEDPQQQGFDLTFTKATQGDPLLLQSLIWPGNGSSLVTASLQHFQTRVTGVTFTFPGGTKTASIGYTDGQLASITDAVDMTSTFQYLPQTDQISAMITPYGTNKFQAGGAQGSNRWLTATDPLGQTERVEYVINATETAGGRAPLAMNEDDSLIPDIGIIATIPTYGRLLHFRNSFYWSKAAMAAATDKSNPPFETAQNVHWLHSTTLYHAAGLEESEKSPNQARIWFLYRGQENSVSYPTSDSGSSPNDIWPMTLPYKVARKIEQGGTLVDEIHTMTYNQHGRVTSITDPLNRTTTFKYADANGLDLTEIRQTTGGVNELVGKFEYSYPNATPVTPPRRVAIATDASGKVTKFEYNSRGQLTKVTNPLNEITSYAYDPAWGGLSTITSPTFQSANNITTFVPDGYYRTWKITDHDQYTVQFDYDKLDRVTKVTYPDATTIETKYERLDPTLVKGRDGRRTAYAYDRLGRPRYSVDPDGAVSQFDWCACGGLNSLTDAEGNTTTWVRDITGRVTDKLLPDSTKVTTAYEPRSGRISSTTDAMGQVASYIWNKDGTLQGITYSNASVPTPGISYTYDPKYRRVSTMADGNGTTTYIYNPITATPVAGAGRLATEDGPYDNDLIGYTYDALGRVTQYSINGNGRAIVFDALGRPQTHTNSLGTFTYQFQGVTPRLSSVIYPAALGQRTDFSYHPASNLSDRERLQTIHNKAGGTAAILSKFDYLYNNVANKGSISKWTQEVDYASSYLTRGEAVPANLAVPAKTGWNGAYDPVDQLISLVIDNESGGSPVLWKRHDFRYDENGNRLNESVLAPPAAAVNNPHLPNGLNQVVARGAGTSYTISGSLDESGSVTVNGMPAMMAGGGTTFTATIPANPGVNPLDIVVSDGAKNRRLYKYKVSIPAGGSANILEYDLAGNLVKDGNTYYTWNAAGQLVSVENGSIRTEFGYDGMGRRTRLVEVENGVVRRASRFLWVGLDLVEERTIDGKRVVKRFFQHGFQNISPEGFVASYYYSKDHLGSIREITDGNRVVVARYSYSPYGERTRIEGSIDSDFGFTGHYYHPATGLYLAPFRAYSAAQGRWISRDGIGEAGGINLYAYCGNDPLNFVDPLGLFTADFGRSWIENIHAGAETLTSNGTGWGSVLWNTGVGSLASLGESIPDALMLGDALGTVSGTPCATAGDWAMAAFQDSMRAVSIASTSLGAVSRIGPAMRGASTAMCFAEGTKIATPSGDVNIEDVKMGDIVYACDFTAGKAVERIVTELKRNFTYYWVDVQVDGETIQATRRHPFWVENQKRWVEAADLKIGMTVRLLDGTTCVISDVRLRELETPETTYNFEVDVDHNYYVGQKHVLVHNPYPLSPQYPPATAVGENFQFNFDTSPKYANSRAAAKTRALNAGILQPGQIADHINGVATHPHLSAEPSNIQPRSDFKDHLQNGHNNNFRTPKHGPLRPGC